jgi:hypothetical protein
LAESGCFGAAAAGLTVAGGSLRVASAAERTDPERLLAILCEEEITFW